MKIFSANVMTKISINNFLRKNFWKNTAFKEIIASSVSLKLTSVIMKLSLIKIVLRALKM